MCIQISGTLIEDITGLRICEAGSVDDLSEPKTQTDCMVKNSLGTISGTILRIQLRRVSNKCYIYCF